MNNYPKLIIALVALAAIAPLEAGNAKKRGGCKNGMCRIRTTAPRVAPAAIVAVAQATVAKAGEVKQDAVIVQGDVKPGDVVGTTCGQTIRVITCESLGDGTTKVTAYEILA